MSIYAVVAINVTEETDYQKYVEAAVPSLQTAGARILVASDSPVTLEGRNPFGRFVVLEFDDRAAFDAWYDSPSYRAARPIRQRSAETGYFLLLDGLA